MDEIRLTEILDRCFDTSAIEYRPRPRERPGPFGLFPLDPWHARLGLPALKTLEALWFEERIEDLEDGYRLPYAEVYRLDPAEAAALELPAQTTSVTVELQTQGYAGGRGFGVVAIMRDGEGRELPANARHGPVFVLPERLVLIPEEVGELCAVLDRGAPAGIAGQLAFIAEVKQAAERCGARLDPYLAEQDVVTPRAIGVEVASDALDHLRVRPVPEGVDEEFVGFGQGPTRSAYTRVEGTRRKRMVLDEETRRIADEVKQRGELRGADVPRFLDNPEAFLPEGVDLSRYSLRVRGLIPRKYNSQPYVRLQPTQKRDWFELDVNVELAAETFDGAELRSDAADSPSPHDGTSDDSSTGGLGADQDLADSPPHVTPEAYADLCRQVVETGERYVLHEDSWIEIAPESAERYLEAWKSTQEDEVGRRVLPKDRARLVLDVISNLDELEFGADAAADSILPELPEYEMPASLRAELMPHQRLGYRWLRYLHEQEYGGLLADDMGLGKTVQVISLLAHLADAGQLLPSLIVLPTSLIENWRRELARFCPRIRRVYVHKGADRLRSAEALAQWEVVLTTYETLRRDQLLLGQVDWSVIACDEAQKVKNPTAQATSAVKGMKARLRLAMTGTPVENGLSELWCIVDWAEPGKLGSQREFREHYERPMQAAEGDGRANLALRLQRQLTPHYLRRIKQDVLVGLPERTDREVVVPLGPRQQRLYVDVVRRVHDGNMIPLEGLQHLIALASHPELYEESGRSIMDLIDECPKLAETLALLSSICDRGEKAVVFTRLRRMQQILQAAIAYRFNIHSTILNGEVQGDRRQDLVDRFNEARDFSVLLLSPEAAGVGLNIVGANHVIHYTRLWNPAKENQATDRVHRIGQTRAVTVYYPIVGGGATPSVEERLHRLLEEKRALARDVVRPRESLSVEKELFELFELGGAA
jgi:hypothetical protein